MSSPAKKQLGLIDPANPPPGAVRLGRLPDPLANDIGETIIELFAIDGLFVHHREWRIKATGAITLVNQCEIPLDGVRWVVETIQQSFERKPSAGGLPRDVFRTEATIQDEHLSLRWGVSVGGEGVGGYTVYNFDRLEYLLHEQAQEFSFTNDLWHSQVRELFKSIAERHDGGEF